MTTLDRRSFLKGVAMSGAALAAPGLLAACGSSSKSASSKAASSSTKRATKTINFQLDWVKNDQFAGFFLGDNHGDYAAEGIKPNFLEGGDVASTEAVIAGGGAQIGISSFVTRLVDAINKGTPLVMVAAMFQRSPAGLMSLPSKPINTPQDIVGKRIGLQEGAQNDIDTVLKLAGLPLNSYKVVPVGYDATPLFQGQVDAYYCYVTSQPIPYELKHTPFVTATIEQLGFKEYAGLICTTRNYLAANRDAVVGFVRATAKGWERAIADPAPGVDLTVSNYGRDLSLDKATETQVLQQQIPLMKSPLTDSKGLLRFDPTLIAGPMYDALRASGRTQLPPVSDVVDTTILDEVYGSKSSLLS
jgi:ABC-type nitrate/sulfonate/bicarbonate transport system substrate-binding protein